MDAEDGKDDTVEEEEEETEQEKILEKFHDLLLDSYDTLILAWRKLLDTSGDGFVSYKEFVLAITSIDYDGDINKLWFALDDDNTKMITLDEFHKPSGELMSLFKTWCESFGGVYETFLAIDKTKKSFILFSDWGPVLIEQGFGKEKDWTPEERRMNCDILHRSFDIDNRGFVTIEDVIFLEENYLARRAVTGGVDVQEVQRLRENRFKLREKSTEAF